MSLPVLYAEINKLLGLSIPDHLPEKDMREMLEEKINELINHDFPALIQLLYRIDVSEQRLRQELAGNPDRDAAVVISNLIIDRQKQKIKTREMYRGRSGEGDW